MLFVEHVRGGVDTVEAVFFGVVRGALGFEQVINAPLNMGGEVPGITFLDLW